MSRWLDEGIAHLHCGVRFYAYWWLDKLPPAEALAAALKGLEDPNDYVRTASAEAFAMDLGIQADLPLLRDRALTERNDLAKMELLKAIQRLEGTP